MNGKHKINQPMIKFFRKIRQKLLSENKFTKYLFYALGEIVLVVIGILIALEINNWNQDKNEQNKIKEYAVSLIQDLEGDIIMTGQIKRYDAFTYHWMMIILMIGYNLKRQRMGLLPR